MLCFQISSNVHQTPFSDLLANQILISNKSKLFKNSKPPSLSLSLSLLTDLLLASSPLPFTLEILSSYSRGTHPLASGRHYATLPLTIDHSSAIQHHNEFTGTQNLQELKNQYPKLSTSDWFEIRRTQRQFILFFSLHAPGNGGAQAENSNFTLKAR